MHPAVRLLGVVACLGAVFGLGVHYDAAYDRHWPYPSGDALRADYESHVDDEAFVSGTVQRRDGGTMTVEVDSDGGPFEMTVTDAAVTAAPGGVVQVVGALEPGRTIAAPNVVVVNENGSSERYKYAVSVVGAVLVLAVFSRRWRFDASGFEVRDRG